MTKPITNNHTPPAEHSTNALPISSFWNGRKVTLLVGSILAVTGAALLIAFPPAALLVGLSALAAKIVIIAFPTILFSCAALAGQMYRLERWDEKFDSILNKIINPGRIGSSFNALHELGPPPFTLESSRRMIYNTLYHQVLCDTTGQLTYNRVAIHQHQTRKADQLAVNPSTKQEKTPANPEAPTSSQVVVNPLPKTDTKKTIYDEIRKKLNSYKDGYRKISLTEEQKKLCIKDINEALDILNREEKIILDAHKEENSDELNLERFGQLTQIEDIKKRLIKGLVKMYSLEL